MASAGAPRLLRVGAFINLFLLLFAVPQPLAAQAQLPTIDEVLTRHVQALGGRAQIESVSTMSMKGSLIAPGGTAPMETYIKAPNKFYRRIDSPVSGLSQNGFNGTVAWSANPSGVREVTGPQVESAKREYSPQRGLRFKEFYSQLVVTGRERVGDKETYRLEAISRDGSKEVFFFDVADGRLLQWDVTVGDTTLRTSYEDFQTIDGLVVPFRWRRSRPDFSWSEQYSEIRLNVSVQDATFDKPTEE